MDRTIQMIQDGIHQFEMRKNKPGSIISPEVRSVYANGGRKKRKTKKLNKKKV